MESSSGGPKTRSQSKIGQIKQEPGTNSRSNASGSGSTAAADQKPNTSNGTGESSQRKGKKRGRKKKKNGESKDQRRLKRFKAGIDEQFRIRREAEQEEREMNQDLHRERRRALAEVSLDTKRERRERHEATMKIHAENRQRKEEEARIYREKMELKFQKEAEEKAERVKKYWDDKAFEIQEEKVKPYYTPMPHAKKTFNNLPEEVLSIIIGMTLKKWSYLFLNKKTLKIAGPMIYKQALGYEKDYEWHWDMDGIDDPDVQFPEQINVEKLFRGLEHESLSQDAPFGRELKLSFLREVRHLRDRKGWVEAGKNPPESLKIAYNSGIVVFPSLERLSIDIDHIPRYGNILPTASSDPEYIPFNLMVMGLSRPKSFCWHSPFYREDFEKGYLTPNQRELIFASSSSSSMGAGGEDRYIPEVVTHHSIMEVSSVIPCYGTLNRVEFWPGPPRRGSMGGPLSINELEISDRIKIIRKILRESHPELFDLEFRKSLSEEELDRRDNTIWEFSQFNEPVEHMLEDELEFCTPNEEDGKLDYDWNNLHWRYNYEQTNSNFIKLWKLKFEPEALKGRIKLQDLNDEKGLEDCRACGCLMPFNEAC